MRVFSRKSISHFTSQQNIKGFTLLELIVASSVALTILGVALGMLSEQRRWMLGDRTRAVSNDNLRLASDLIGQDIKQAGERLEADRFLPAISIEPGSTTQPSALVLQRKLLEQTLPVCQSIDASTTTIDIAVMTGTVIDNCEYSYVTPSGGEPSSDLTALQPSGNLRLWRTYRCTQDGVLVANNTDPCTATTSSAKAWAYIYDEVNQRGEFFQYDLEEQGSCASFSSQTCQRIRRVGSTWKYSYALNTTTPPKLYLFEERRYSLVADDNTSRTDDYILQLSVNRQTPIRIANQVRNFRVWAKVPTSYSPTNPDTDEALNWGCAVSDSNADSPNPDAPNQWYCTTFNFDSTKSEPDQRLKRMMNWQGLQGLRITLTGINPNEQAYKVDETLSNNPLKLSSEFLPRNVASQEN